MAQIVSVGQIQHQVLGEFLGEIFDPVRVVAEQCNVELQNLFGGSLVKVLIPEPSPRSTESMEERRLLFAF